MKKAGIFFLLTGMLFAFTVGFYIGRNANNQPITLTISDRAQISETETTDISETTAEATQSPAITEDGKINLNLATKEDLMTLPGIGETLATLILNYRNTNGDFTVVDDLMNVSGIGERKLEALRDFVTVP